MESVTRALRARSAAATDELDRQLASQLVSSPDWLPSFKLCFGDSRYRHTSFADAEERKQRLLQKAFAASEALGLVKSTPHFVRKHGQYLSRHIAQAVVDAADGSLIQPSAAQRTMITDRVAATVVALAAHSRVARRDRAEFLSQIFGADEAKNAIAQAFLQDFPNPTLLAPRLASDAAAAAPVPHPSGEDGEGHGEEEGEGDGEDHGDGEGDGDDPELLDAREARLRLARRTSSAGSAREGRTRDAAAAAAAAAPVEADTLGASDSLLSHLVSAAAALAQHLLQSRTPVDMSSADVTSKMNAALEEQPVLRFLALLQRDLFVRCRNLKSYEEPIWLKAVRYVQLLLDTAADVTAQFAAAVQNEPAAHNLLRTCFETTFVCLLVPSVLLVVGPHLEDPSCFGFANSITDALVKLLQSAAVIRGASEPAPQQSPLSPEAAHIRAVESPHPYDVNTAYSPLVHVEGATHLLLEFDRRCETAQSDRLLILDGVGNPVGNEVGGWRGGRNGSWPRGLLIVNGPTVRINFNTGTLGPAWGFRILVKPIHYVTPTSVLADLQDMLLVAWEHALSALIRGPVSSDLEQSHNSWLVSPLLVGGLEHQGDSSVSAELPAFVSELITAAPTTAAGMLMQAIAGPPAKSDVHSRRHDKAVRAAFAAALKHHLLLDAAIDAANLVLTDGATAFAPGSVPSHMKLRTLYKSLADYLQRWSASQRLLVVTALATARANKPAVHGTAESKSATTEQDSKDASATGTTNESVQKGDRHIAAKMVAKAIYDRSMFLLHVRARPAMDVAATGMAPLERSMSGGDSMQAQVLKLARQRSNESGSTESVVGLWKAVQQLSVVQRATSQDALNVDVVDMDPTTQEDDPAARLTLITSFICRPVEIVATQAAAKPGIHRSDSQAAAPAPAAGAPTAGDEPDDAGEQHKGLVSVLRKLMQHRQLRGASRLRGLQLATAELTRALASILGSEDRKAAWASLSVSQSAMIAAMLRAVSKICCSKLWQPNGHFLSGLHGAGAELETKLRDVVFAALNLCSQLIVHSETPRLFKALACSIWCVEFDAADEPAVVASQFFPQLCALVGSDESAQLALHGSGGVFMGQLPESHEGLTTVSGLLHRLVIVLLCRRDGQPASGFDTAAPNTPAGGGLPRSPSTLFDARQESMDTTASVATGPSSVQSALLAQFHEHVAVWVGKYCAAIQAHSGALYASRSLELQAGGAHDDPQFDFGPLSDPPAAPAELVSAERYTYRLLQLLSCVVTGPAGASFLTTPQWLPLVLSTLQLGSPRIQLLCFRLLRSSLSTILPVDFDDIFSTWRHTPLVGSEAHMSLLSLHSSSGPFVSVVLARIGSLLTSFAVTPPLASVTGEVVHATAAELVSLVRWMLRTPSWSPAVRQQLNSAMGAVEEVVTAVRSGSGTLHPQLGAVCAALAVLGGHFDHLRVGCRAKRVTSSGPVALSGQAVESGTVTRCDRLNCVAYVVFDSSPKRVLACALSKLVAMPDQRVLPGWLELTPELVHAFVAVANCLASGVAGASLQSTTTAAFHLLGSELQTLSMKCLCVALQHPPSAAVAFKEGALSTLVAAAVQPAKASDDEEEMFPSLAQLEASDERVRELAVGWSIRQANAAHGFTADSAMDGVFGGAHVSGLSHFITAPEQSALLPHSPFASEPVSLPCVLDVPSAMGVVFGVGEALSALRCAAAVAGAGVVRADRAVPVGVPVYYFEVQILDGGDSGSAEMEMGSANCVAVGFVRDGLQLATLPGCNNSYAFGADGGLYHTSEESVAECVDSGIGFSTGDVVGCGWNLRSGQLFFSLNGSKLDMTCEGPSSRGGSRLIPAIWLHAANTRIRVNFGQDVFLLEPESLLPEGYRDSQPDRAAPMLSDVELRRRAMAEDLLVFLPYFPLELIVNALEQHSDNSEVAANWLMENGFQEMDRLQEQVLLQSQMEAEEKQRHDSALETAVANSLEGFDDDEEAMHALAAIHESMSGTQSRSGATASGGNTAAAAAASASSTGAGGAGSGAGRADADDTGDWDALEDVAADAQASSGRDTRDPSAWLDDEVDADVPVGVEAGNAELPDPSMPSGGAAGGGGGGGAGSQGDSSSIGDGLAVKVEELIPGMAVRVRDVGALTVALEMQTPAHTAGAVGVVLTVNASRGLALVGFPCAATGFESRQWMPARALVKPTGLWQDPASPLLSRTVSTPSSAESMLHDHIRRLQWVLCIRLIRRTVLHLIDSWPSDIPFDVQRLGGVAPLLKLLRLAGSECLLMMEGGGSSPRQAHMLEGLRNKFKGLLVAEAAAAKGRSDVPIPTPLLTVMGSTPGALPEGTIALDGPDPVTRVLAEEVVRHFRGAAHHPPVVEVRESPHPYDAMSDIRGEVRIAGASKLFVKFDGRTHMPADALTLLAFYRDNRFTDMLKRFSGRHPQSFSSSVVDGNHFAYRFKSGPSSDWGFRFSVSARGLRLDDSAALAGRNLELGVWLLELLLSCAPDVLRFEYLIDVFDASLAFARRTRGEARARGFELLVRTLQEVRAPPPAPYPARRIDLSKLTAVRAEMNRVGGVERAGTGVLELHSAYMQSLVELMVAAHLGGLPGQSVVSGQSVTPGAGTVGSAVGLYDNMRLHIHDAVYGEESGACVDVTAEARANAAAAGGQLLMVSSSLAPSELVAHMPSSSTRATRVRYSLVPLDAPAEESKSSRVVHDSKDDAAWDSVMVGDKGQGAADGMMLRAQSSWFTRVLQVAELAACMSSKSRLPPQFIEAGLRLHSTLRHGRRLLKQQAFSSTDRVVLPSWGPIGSTFTLRFRLFVAQPPKGLPGNAKPVRRTTSTSSSGSRGSANRESEPVSAAAIAAAAVRATAAVPPPPPPRPSAAVDSALRASMMSLLQSAVQGSTRSPAFGLEASPPDSDVHALMQALVAVGSSLPSSATDSPAAPAAAPSADPAAAAGTASTVAAEAAAVAAAAVSGGAQETSDTEGDGTNAIGGLFSALALSEDSDAEEALAAGHSATRRVSDAGDIEFVFDHGEGHDGEGDDEVDDDGLVIVHRDQVPSHSDEDEEEDDDEEGDEVDTGMLVAHDESGTHASGLDGALGDYLSGLSRWMEDSSLTPSMANASGRVALAAGRGAGRDRPVQTPNTAGIGWVFCRMGEVSGKNLGATISSQATTVEGNVVPNPSAVNLNIMRGGAAVFSVNMPVGEWVDVALVKSAEHMSLFLNGQAAASASVEQSPAVVGDDPLVIGAPVPGVEGVGFDGAISCMEVVSRAAKPTPYRVSDAVKQNMDSAAVEAWLLTSEAAAVSAHDVESAQMLHSRWSVQQDNELLEAVRLISEEKELGVGAEAVELSVIAEATERGFLKQFASLREVNAEQACSRMALLRLLNHCLALVLPLIDFRPSQAPWSLAHRVSSLRDRMFFCTKDTLWRGILSRTMSKDAKPSVQVNRSKSLKAYEHGDPEGRRSVFGQLFRQLHFLPPSVLRQASRTWGVTYLGEGAIDAGGPFRDSISHLCSDLQSTMLPLFVRCANSLGYGDNQEMWFPNPSSTASLHLSMFGFVGKLMGVAIRGKHILNLDFPPMVWKLLVGDTVTLDDLRAVDALTCSVIDKMQHMDESAAATFETEHDLRFTTTSSDGRTVELVADGANKRVTWENRLEWVDLLINYRLHEVDTQIAAVRHGLGTIVPVQLLSLFTWQEFELQVCGRREVDLEFLKANTIYRGWAEDDQHIQNMWATLEEFSTKQREMFLRFVWGRSRLPLSREDFTQKFEVMRFYGPRGTSMDGVLPISHTCFFQLELPEYSNYKTMRDRILYAITSCVGIDTDGQGGAEHWVDEE